MKNMKNTLIISSYLLLIALFFSGGYVLGGHNGTNDAPPPEPSAAVMSMSSHGGGDNSPQYEVIIEDGVLKIYKCIGENKTMIMSEEISESVFPSGDVEDLKKGVRFPRLEAAQQLFENFVS